MQKSINSSFILAIFVNSRSRKNLSKVTRFNYKKNYYYLKNYFKRKRNSILKK